MTALLDPGLWGAPEYIFLALLALAGVLLLVSIKAGRWRLPARYSSLVLIAVAFLVYLAIALKPSEPLAAIESRARADLRAGRFGEAHREFSRALKLDPRRAALWEGKTYAALGQAVGAGFSIERL